jgi:hypothetical protein
VLPDLEKERREEGGGKQRRGKNYIPEKDVICHVNKI